MTTDIDTRNAAFVEARLRIGSAPGASGTCSLPTVSSEGVAVAFSADGGQSWTYLGQRYHFTRSVFWSATLPTEAKAPAVRFVFWQPSFSGANSDEWTLDDVFVGYSDAVNPSSLAEDFAGGVDPALFIHRPWVTAETGYCGAAASEPSAVFRETGSELTTRDLDLSGDFPLVQFE